MPSKLLDRVLLARADEQCEKEFWTRSRYGPQKVRQICIKCLVNSAETVLGKICKQCREVKAVEYRNSDSNEQAQVKYRAKLKERNLLKRYMKGDL